MIPAPVLTTALRAAAPFPGGPSFNILCSAMAQALTLWLPSGVTLQGVTSGVTGAGTVNGMLFFSGVPGVVNSTLQGSGLVGTASSQMAQVIAAGLNSGLNGLTYAGASVGVGQGLDQSQVSGVSVPTLAQTLETTHRGLCSAAGGSGSSVPGFYVSMARAIGVVIQTGRTRPPGGQVTPTSPLGPSSTLGTSLSVPT